MSKEELESRIKELKDLESYHWLMIGNLQAHLNDLEGQLSNIKEEDPKRIEV